ncbi:hypothetical protein NOR51B_2139 [Luminiphilus syltensis NOR5-1B]|uniref:Uncharacterized protein n=1 Tax=Luminiphilus syltensis NOR5-1B TaxID=565045 RepID=B8KVM4_9GAMM|nr:hypothetical protein NOR51B_2139 [Luminiphilus syltensis NOR5-1B]
MPYPGFYGGNGGSAPRDVIRKDYGPIALDAKFVETQAFDCTFCCVGDACNYSASGCFVQPGTMWTIP